MNVALKSDPMTAAGGRNVVAVLGPTNTGKTHLAIERMLAHPSGVIGLPLRLLAREVYDRVAARAGADQVALITGEEKIMPPAPRYRVCTVEAMPSQTDASFLAIDEIQLAADLERGHVFTDRLLNLRGRDETLLLGAATMRSIVEKLLPGTNVVTRPRMSVLAYAGWKKITRLPRRSAVVAFSADEVYAIAELIRRQRGGAAVVLGSLSPRTRNAQVEIFQSGDVDFLVATDAIGMGLNLDVDHVAFASDRKFDGYQFRRLSAVEFGQVAGRAGRHLRDGTFGVTGRADGLEDPLVEALETHRFDSVKTVQWRNRDLDFSSLAALHASLDLAPPRDGLSKALPSVDVATLETVGRDDAVRQLAQGRDAVSLLWDVCQVPDYRKIAPANHAELIATLFGFLARDGSIPSDWLGDQVAYADRTDGDIDTLANRIAHIRTWTFAANQSHWLRDPLDWQERTRAIEDRLSDALHERLTARFVDRRTSVLMRRLKENAMLEAEVTAAGDVLVEGQHVGNLDGFRFAPDPNADGPEAKALRVAAQKSLAGEIAERAERVATAVNAEFVLADDSSLRWRGAAIARLAEGDDPLRPRLILLADEALPVAARDRVQARIDLWLANHVETLLKPLFDLRDAESLPAAARGIAFRLAESFGIIERGEIAEEVRALDQETRAGLRALGVRFGAYHIHVPILLKPGPSALLATLWALKNGGLDIAGLSDLVRLAASGRTSVPIDPAIAAPLYRVTGYRLAGNRAVRIDILERLADLIRPLIAWRPATDGAAPPEGAVAGRGFTVTVAMTSLLGCAGDDFASVLRSLGYRCQRVPVARPDAVAPTGAAEAADVRETAAADAATTDGAASAGAAATTAEAAEPASASAQAAAGAVPEPIAEPAPDPATATETAPPDESAAATHPVATTGSAAGGAEPRPASEPPPAERPEASEAATGDAAGAPADTRADAPPEPAFLEVWRPGRPDRGRPPNRSRRTEARQSPRPAGDRPDDGERPAEQRPPRRERRRKPHQETQGRPRAARPRPVAASEKVRVDKPADPDSPFAALAALKTQLEAQQRNDKRQDDQ